MSRIAFHIFYAEQRAKSGLNRAEFAAKIGISHETGSKYENGEWYPSFATLRKLERTMDQNLELFYTPPAYRLELDILTDAPKALPEELLRIIRKRRACTFKYVGDIGRTGACTFQFQSKTRAHLEEIIDTYSANDPSEAVYLKNTIKMVDFNPDDEFGGVKNNTVE